MKKRNLMKVFVSLALGCVIAGGVSATDNVTASAADTTFTVGETVIDMSSFVTSPKAAVRYDAQTDDQGNEYTGMRFFTGIDPETRTNLENLSSQGYTVSFGTIVTNYDTMKDLTDFTFEYLPENTDEKTYYLDVKANAWVLDENKETETDDSGYAWAGMDQFSAVVYGITEANFATERIARGYVSVSKDGETQTYYASYTNESRSVADVAMSALQANDYDTEATDADEKEFKALNKYAKASDLWEEKYTDDNFDYLRYISTFDELSTYATDDILKADGTEGANVCLVQKADIDLNTSTWKWTVTNSSSTPSSVIPNLKVSLDGNGKKLSGLSLTTTLKNANGYTKLSNIGFFGTIATGVTVENLIFEGSLGGYTDETKTDVLSVTKMHIGLFAWKNAGTIKNCYIKGEIVNKPTFSSAVFTTVGAVYMNSGSMENVMTDMLFVRGTSSSTTAAVSHSAFAFAVSNTGKVENCVTVMSRYGETQKINSSGLRIWTTVELGTEVKGEVTYTWGAPFTVDGTSIYPSSPYSGDDIYKVKAMPDQDRSNCYIFNDYEDLISDEGTGYNDDNKAGLTSSNLGSYTEKTGADGKSALGAAWTFDSETGTIKLCGTVVWQTA